MSAEYQVWLFGKQGCPKCKTLSKRVDAILKKKEWQDVEKVYWDVETEDGLVSFSKTECLNPQRIPGLVVARRTEDGCFQPIPNRAPEKTDKTCKGAKLFNVMGLQTDYTDKGVITPRMVESVLTEARAS